MYRRFSVYGSMHVYVLTVLASATRACYAVNAEVPDCRRCGWQRLSARCATQ